MNLQFEELFNSIIMEGRREDLEYTEKNDKKGNPDSVTVVVSGKLAERVTKVVNELTEYKKQIDENKKEYDRRSDLIKAEFGTTFFDETDKVRTRIIECKNSVVKLSKVVEKDEVTVKADPEKVKKLLSDIINLCEAQTSDLGNAVKALIEGADVIKEEKKKAPPEKIYLNKKDEKGKIIKESVGEKIANWIKKAVQKVSTVFKHILKKTEIRADVIDEKLSELKKLVA
jgi:hypothetical protein